MPGETKHMYTVFGVVALALLFTSMSGNVFVIALPAMLEDLHTSLAWIGWTLTGFQLAQSIVMPMAGKLGDDMSRKNVFIASLILFTASSVAAGFAPNVYVLITARIAQAIGGGALLPTATGLVSDAFGSKRATAIGLFTSIFPLGGVIGPMVGGFIVEHLSWRWLFFYNLPLMVGLIVLSVRMLPESKPAATTRSIDTIGAGLFTGGLVAILSAMTVWGNTPEAIHEPLTWAGVAVGMAMLGLFLYHEDHTKRPMIELDLLRWRPFWAANLYNFIFGASVFGFFSFIPYYATAAYGMSASQNGIILTPRSLTMAVLSTISSFFIIKFGYRWPMILGALGISISLFLLSLGLRDISIFGMQVPNVVLIASLVMVSGFGMGISGPASNNAALDLVPDKVSAVAGLRGMFRSTGGVFGTAGIILALSYFQDKTAGLQTIFFVLSAMILLSIPVVFLIPDTARMRYVEERDRRRGDGDQASAKPEPAEEAAALVRK